MDAASDTPLVRIGQIAVRVRELDTAIEFYRDTLGLEFLFRVPRMAFLDCGGVRLMLAVPEEEEYDHPASTLYFEVAEIEGAFRELSSRGVPFEGPPHRVADLGTRELWMAFFRDPAENLMALMAERPAAD